MSEQQKKRREVLESGVLAAAGALLAGLAVACGDDGDEKPSPGVDGGVDGGGGTIDAGHDAAAPLDAAAADADVAVLNNLLKAEYNAIAAYAVGGGAVTAATSADPLFALKDTIVAIATNIAGQHTLHATALVSAINGLGGTPIAQSSVTFVPPPEVTANLTITNILKFAANAERAAAIAYNHAVEVLEASNNRYLASVIEGDESQHFIILAALVLGLAAPGTALNPTTGASVPPKAFVRTLGTQQGLDTIPNNFS